MLMKFGPAKSIVCTAVFVLVATVQATAVPRSWEAKLCDQYSSADDKNGRTRVPLEKIDVEKAMSLCENAVSAYPNEPRYAFQLGRVFQKTGDLRTAIEYYQKAADQGYAYAQYDLAAIVLGKGGGNIEKDTPSALKYLTLAAEQNFIPAQNMLGLVYDDEESLRDYAKAIYWFNKASDQGDAEAKFYIAMHYSKGWGVQKSDSEAHSWLLNAAKLGYAEAQYAVGFDLQNGRGVTADAAAAVGWINKSADQGYSEAQYAMGLALLKGQGITKNDSEAFQWIKKAAMQDNPNACNALGTLLAQGTGVKQDKYEASYWFERAIAKGSEPAKHNLALLNLPKDGLTREQRVASLKNAYSSYLTVKVCYEARQGYLIQMITRSDFDQAKLLMRKIENNSQLPRDQKDELWDVASKQSNNLRDLYQLLKAFGGSTSDDMRLSCRSALIDLQKAAGADDTASPKRDF
ncbi:MAG: hypothetical protein EKK42_15040 [Pseudonocardiaceae bacterium]|nr:MAG: hypothetical protein EKK42_15040 [Pseudonocardiaceae bacterium]